MRIAVFGTGGAGGYFGGRLAQAGEDVTFIARGEHLRAIREHGPRVESVKGDFEIQAAQATDNPADVLQFHRRAGSYSPCGWTSLYIAARATSAGSGAIPGLIHSEFIALCYRRV